MPSSSNMAVSPTAEKVGWARRDFPRAERTRRLSPPMHLSALVHQRTAALGERAEGLVRRDGGAQLVEVPGALRFGGLLHLEQIHGMNLAPVRPHSTLAEQLVVGGHLLHFGDHRLPVGIAL